MARVAANPNTNMTTTPFMDQLSHAVIKETSKNLRHYIDIKRRENGFILNPNSCAFESAPIRARYMYGTAKHYPPLYGSSFSDNDIKLYMRNFQQQKRQAYSTLNASEKQMCREELNFHMRTKRSSSKESQKFSELRLRPSARSASVCSVASGHDFRRETSKPAFKLSRTQQNQLVDDTANILATMVKTRRSIYETNLSLQQTPHLYISRNTNPSPRPPNEQTHSRSTQPSALPRSSFDSTYTPNDAEVKKSKRRTKNAQEKAISIMHNAKLIKKGLLAQYDISVTTGDCNGASSDAPIQIKLYGKNGFTQAIDLTKSRTHRVPFQKGQTDVFTIETDHVGDFAGINIGHDRQDTRSGWFLDKVSIFDSFRQTTYEIPCNAWLSNKSTDQQTKRNFPVTSMKSKETHDSTKYTTDSGSQSDVALAKLEDSLTSDSTIRNKNNAPKSTKKPHRKPRRRSNSSTTMPKKSTSLTPITNHNSHSPPRTTTIESHFKSEEFPSSPPVLTRRNLSPEISSPSHLLTRKIKFIIAGILFDHQHPIIQMKIVDHQLDYNNVNLQYHPRRNDQSEAKRKKKNMNMTMKWISMTSKINDFSFSFRLLFSLQIFREDS
ncbi:hypothetical protein I4U23_006463 [Adineta vaga]|nr:hypothetical protein I4U23_006463 [Adineta vaga]